MTLQQVAFLFQCYPRAWPNSLNTRGSDLGQVTGYPDVHRNAFTITSTLRPKLQASFARNCSELINMFPTPAGGQLYSWSHYFTKWRNVRFFHNPNAYGRRSWKALDPSNIRLCGHSAVNDNRMAVSKVLGSNPGEGEISPPRPNTARPTRPPAQRVPGIATG